MLDFLAKHIVVSTAAAFRGMGDDLNYAGFRKFDYLRLLMQFPTPNCACEIRTRDYAAVVRVDGERIGSVLFDQDCGVRSVVG